MRLAEGDNFELELDRGVLALRVVRRPDLDSSRGADSAETMASLIARHAARVDVSGAIIDISQAPPVAGPRTQEALGRMLASVAREGKRAAVVVSSATQRLQMERLAGENAPGLAAVHDGAPAAHAWLVGARASG